MASKFNALFVTGLLLQLVAILNVIHLVKCEQSTGLVHNVNINDTIECCSMNKNLLPSIYCYRGVKWNLHDIFKTVKVDLIFENTNSLTLYEADDSHGIEEQMSSNLAAKWSWNKFLLYFWEQKSFNLNPFKNSCFSFKTDSDFEIKINDEDYDFRFYVGLILFVTSHVIPIQHIFFSLSAVVIGFNVVFVIGILLTLYIICYKVPKNKYVILFVVGICAVTVQRSSDFFWTQCIQIIWLLHANYINYVSSYSLYIFAFAFVVLCIYAPGMDHMINDFKAYTLQFIGLALIMISSHNSLAIVILDVLIINLYRYATKHWPLGLDYLEEKELKELKRKSNCERQRAYYQRQKDLKKNEKKNSTKIKC